MPKKSADAQVEELLARITEWVGDPEELYSLAYDGDAVIDLSEADADEPPNRVLCPPASEDAVREAEASLGFALPLLRAVYTRVGNGGLCLRLLGLDGGQVGGDDLFPGMSAVEICHTLDGWRAGGKLHYLPPRLLPINDDLVCGMVDYVDCRTTARKIWRTDSGSLIERQPTLMQYLRDAIDGYRGLVERDDRLREPVTWTHVYNRGDGASRTGTNDDPV